MSEHLEAIANKCIERKSPLRQRPRPGQQLWQSNSKSAFVNYKSIESKPKSEVFKLSIAAADIVNLVKYDDIAHS